MAYIFGALAVYVGFIAVLYTAQRSLLYHPDQSIPDPAAYDVPQMTAIRVGTADGYTLLAWWRPPTAQENPVLVYFHGNAGHIGARTRSGIIWMPGLACCCSATAITLAAAGSPAKTLCLPMGGRR